MSDQELKKQVKRLREQISDLRYKYHVLNDPAVTDKMYEGLMDELRKIEEKYPELITSDSPTQRVSGTPLDKFQKVQHTVPQWSFNDAFTKEDLENWQERIYKFLEKKLGSRPSDLNFSTELKIDGLHIVLTYKNGLLQTAATRGDGKTGEDVTQNIRTIHSVPIKLREQIDLIAEGEVWMGTKMFNKINQEREKKGEALYANPRNIAAGTIRQLDSRVVAKRKLSLTAYDISDGEIPETQEEELKKLKKLGFPTGNDWKVCKNLNQVIDFWKKWEKKKTSKEFWIDGVVVKVNQKKYQDLLGFTGKAPRWALALKFTAEQGTTKIKDIYVQVGRTGALTPVALLEPVQLAGSTVTHATLHNFEEIERLGVRVGDTVVVEKAGDIIPKIVRVLEKMRTGKEKKFKTIEKCPICGAQAEKRKISDKKKETSAALFCTNSKCYAQELRRINHFVSKHAFNIDGLGKKIVEQLVNEGLIKNTADILTLTQGDLEPLERFAEKSAENLIKAIGDSKEISFSRFIYALGIHHVGEETAIALAEYFGSLERLRKASREDLEQIQDVGPNVSESIINYFINRESVELVEDLLKNGVKIKKQEIKKQDRKFTGKTFVLTGTLEKMTRDEAKNLIREMGGSVSGSVSKNTDFVVVGSDPGSKYEKAKKLDVEILSEQEFIKKL